MREILGSKTPRGAWVALLTVGALGLSACGSGGGFDWDLRPDRYSTTDAARATTAARPMPDARGVISYPGYQVVLAQRGERVGDIASRLGIDAAALARHNAIATDTVMRGGELLVLPSRVSEPEGFAGGPIATTPLGGTGTTGNEPPRHTVERGETAFTIARLYNVTPRALAEWNGLPADMSVREGQILVIPVAQTAAASGTGSAAGAPMNAAGLTAPAAPAAGLEATGAGLTSMPGQGSATPVPPSASQPLPDSNPAPAGTSASAASGTPAPAPVADMASQRSASSSRLAMPVQGRIIRAYAPGRNDGIGIGAAAGTEVHAAAAGTVAAITEDTDQVPILVIRHENNLLTVYANIDNIRVSRGDRVSRGQAIAGVRAGDPSFLHFEVREGFESVDPMPYLQ